MLGVFFSFSGRIGRRNFWLVTFISLILLGISFAIAVSGVEGFANILEAGPQAEAEFEIAVVKALSENWMILAGVGLFTAFMNTAAAIKRLHDLDRTGWLYLFAIGISIIPVIGALIYLAWLIYVGFFPGTKGPNHYGPGPHKMFSSASAGSKSGPRESRATGNYGMEQTDDWHGTVDSYKEALRRKSANRIAEDQGTSRANKVRRERPQHSKGTGFGKRGTA